MLNLKEVSVEFWDIVESIAAFDEDSPWSTADNAYLLQACT